LHWLYLARAHRMVQGTGFKAQGTSLRPEPCALDLYEMSYDYQFMRI
jgi:hypothetical protein